MAPITPIGFDLPEAKTSSSSHDSRECDQLSASTIDAGNDVHAKGNGDLEAGFDETPEGGEDEHLGEDFTEYDRWIQPSIAQAERNRESSMFEKGEAGVWSTRIQELEDLGPNVALYFYFMQWLIIVFGVLSVFSLPALMVSVGGERIPLANRDFFGFFRFTVGNIGDGCNVGSPPDYCPSTGRVCLTNSSLVVDESVSQAGRTVSFWHAAGLFFFSIALEFLRYRTAVISHRIEAKMVTVSDYSVHVRGLPKNVSTKKIVEHFSELFNPTKLSKGHFDRVEEPPNDAQDWRAKDGAKGAVVNTWVADVVRVTDNAKQLITFLAHSRDAKELRRIRAEWKKFGENSKFANSSKRRQAKGEELILALKMSDVSESLEKQGALVNDDSAKCVGAFVTFQYGISAEHCLAEYARQPNHGWCNLFGKQRADLKLDGHTLSVTRSPEPQDVIWENLPKTSCQKAVKGFFTALAAAVLLLVSFYLVLTIKLRKKELWDEFENSDVVESLVNISCSTLMKENIRKHGAQGGYEATLEVKDGACKKYAESYSAISLLNLALVGLAVTVNVLLKRIMGKLTEAEYHVSRDKKDFRQMQKVFIAQFLNTAILPLMVSGGGDFIPSALKALNIMNGELNDFSIEWYTQVGVPMIQMVIGLVVCEAFFRYIFVHHFYSRKHAEYRHYTKETEGRHHSLIGQITEPCLHALRALLLWTGNEEVLRLVKPNSRAMQSDLDALWIGPPFRTVFRYAFVLNIAITCLLFAPALPILPIVAFVGFSLHYWIDKYLLLRFNSTPPVRDERQQVTANAFLFYFLVVALLFAIWILGNPIVLGAKTSGSFSSRVGRKLSYDIVSPQIAIVLLVVLMRFLVAGEDTCYQLAQGKAYVDESGLETAAYTGVYEKTIAPLNYSAFKLLPFLKKMKAFADDHSAWRVLTENEKCRGWKLDRSGSRKKLYMENGEVEERGGYKRTWEVIQDNLGLHNFDLGEPEVYKEAIAALREQKVIQRRESQDDEDGDDDEDEDGEDEDEDGEDEDEDGVGEDGDEEQDEGAEEKEGQEGQQQPSRNLFKTNAPISPAPKEEKGASGVSDDPAGFADWAKYTNEQGEPYWYNSATGESSWEVPY